MGLKGNLFIDPISLNFGGVRVGNVSAKSTVTLSNNGTASLNVTALDTPTAPFARSGGTCSDTLPITIAASEICTLTYTFSPSVIGFAEQLLTVTADAPGSGSIELMGSGIQGHLLIDPTSLDFGNVVVGSVSDGLTLMLANNGTDSLEVTVLTEASGAFARAGGTCPEGLPITIEASGHCLINYSFSPQATGLAEQTLTVSANSPGSGTIDLSGTGIQGNLVIDPNAIDFGTLAAGDLSAVGTITLANNGNARLNVDSLTLAEHPFVRTNDGSCGNVLPFTIGAGASCTLTYLFAPTEAGSAQQGFVLGSNASGETDFQLSGEAVPGQDAIFFDGFEPFN